jgi:hypothetical protein
MHDHIQTELEGYFDNVIVDLGVLDSRGLHNVSIVVTTRFDYNDISDVSHIIATAITNASGNLDPSSIQYEQQFNLTPTGPIPFTGPPPIFQPPVDASSIAITNRAVGVRPSPLRAGGDAPVSPIIVPDDLTVISDTPPDSGTVVAPVVSPVIPTTTPNDVLVTTPDMLLANPALTASGGTVPTKSATPVDVAQSPNIVGPRTATVQTAPTVTTDTTAPVVNPVPSPTNDNSGVVAPVVTPTQQTQTPVTTQTPATIQTTPDATSSATTTSSSVWLWVVGIGAGLWALFGGKR